MTAALARQEGEYMSKVYTVYNNNTDELVILDGTREECAKAMGINYDTFHTVQWHFKHGHKTKWAIFEAEKELPPQATFGERVRYNRIKQGISLRELGKKTYISYQALQRYETNIAEPYLSTAKNIADALGLSLDYLVKGE